jgi:Fe-S cluster assembly protein SufD
MTTLTARSPMSASTPATLARAWSERALARAKAAREGAWALERRRAAIATLGTLSPPRRDDELWRRTDFGTLEQALETLDPFKQPPPARNIDDLPSALIERLAGEAGRVGLVVQRESGVVLEQTHPTLTKQGITVCSMDRATREHEALLKSHLGALLHDDYDWYAALGSALRQGGAFVHVPKGVKAELPVRFFHWLDGAGRLVAPRSVVIVEEGAELTMVEELLSETVEGASFHAGGVEVFVGANAKLTYGQIQDWGRNVFHYGNARAQVGRDAELQWMQVMVGGRMTKTNAYYDLNGEGARAFVNGFMFGDQRQHFHLHTLQRHLEPHTTSDLLIKCCLKDRARSVYQGLIQVAEGAQRTDAYQANRNLLLSDQARADSIPGLEILANDVRCTHGATIGYVEPEHLYYLMARGLPRPVAERLIVEAFFEPVIGRIPLETVRERLRGEIEHKID